MRIDTSGDTSLTSIHATESVCTRRDILTPAHHQKKGEGQRETLRVHSPEMDGRGEGGENGGVSEERSEERSGQYEAMRCVIGA